jgi:nitrogen fixation NifU-like protein
MSELRELYREVILDHNKSPRNFGPLDGASSSAEGHNPLCGDRVAVAVLLEQDRIKDIRFEGCGCAISQASASLMTEAAKGKTVAEARKIFKEFHHMVTVDDQCDIDELDPLSSLAGVREYPARIKCATLAWHALFAAIDKDKPVVSTE